MTTHEMVATLSVSLASGRPRHALAHQLRELAAHIEGDSESQSGMLVSEDNLTGESAEVTWRIET